MPPSFEDRLAESVVSAIKQAQAPLITRLALLEQAYRVVTDARTQDAAVIATLQADALLLRERLVIAEQRAMTPGPAGERGEQFRAF